MLKRSEPEEPRQDAPSFSEGQPEGSQLLQKHRKMDTPEDATSNANAEHSTQMDSQLSSYGSDFRGQTVTLDPPTSSTDPQALVSLPSLQSQEQSNENAVASPMNLKVENGVSPMQQDGTKSPTAEDGTQDKEKKQKHAMDFLLKVRSHYAQTPTVYNEFLEIMKDFKSSVIDTPEVIAKVKELFKGHNNLIEEFNAFLPPGYKIEVEPEPNNQADLEHARNYVRKIKNRFALQPHIYKTFLEILHSYYQGQHQINEVLEEVGDLFQNHQDLLEEFRLFLPKSVSEGGPTAVAAAQKKLLPKKVTKPPREREEIKPRERAIEHPRRRAAAPPIGSLDEDRRSTRSYPERERRTPPLYDDERPRRREERFHFRKEMEKPKRIGPPSYVAAPEFNLFSEVNFFHEVRRRLNNNSMFHEFLKCINLFSQDIISKAELVSLIKDLLGKQEDLFASFKTFIGYLEPDAVPDKAPAAIPASSEPVESEEYANEDEKYELDLMIDLNSATMRSLEAIMEQSEQTNAKISLDSLDTIHIRNIERIYGDRSADIMDALYTNPPAAIPVIQKRLRQKNQEWMAAKKELQKPFLQQTALAQQPQQAPQPQQPQVSVH